MRTLVIQAILDYLEIEGEVADAKDYETTDDIVLLEILLNLAEKG